MIFNQEKQDKMAYCSDSEILELCINNSDQLFLITDYDYNILKISPNWERITGLQKETTLGLSFWDFVIESDKGYFDGGKNKTFDCCISLSFVKNKIVHFSIKVIEQKNNIGIILVNCEELFSSMETQTRCNQHLKSVYDTIPFCLGIVKNRIIIEVNQYLCDFLGYSRDELLNKDALILYAERSEYENVGTEKYKTMDIFGKAWVETKWKHKNGRIYKILLGSRYLDINNKQAGTFFSATELGKDVALNLIGKHNDDVLDILVESAYDGIIHHDINGKILTWNKSCEKLFGITSDEIINKTNFEFTWDVFDEDLNYINTENHPSMLSLSSGNETINKRIKIVRKDGSFSWVSINTRLLYANGNRTVDSVIVVLKDITSEFSLKEKLKESEKLYRLIAEKTTDVIWLMSLGGESIYVSPSIQQFTGFTQDEYLSQNIDTRFTPESAILAKRLFIEGVDKYSNGQKIPKNFSLRVKLEYKCKDGSFKWGEILVTPFYSDSGKLFGIHGVTRDVTAEMQTLKELNNKTELFNSFYGNMPSGSAIYQVINNGNTAKDFIIQNFNEKSLELENKSLKQVLGKSIGEVEPGIENSGLVGAMQLVWKTGISKYVKIVVKNDENKVKHFENYLFKIPTGEIVTIYNEITEKVLIEEQLRKNTQKLDYALQASTEGIWEYYFDTHDVIWNSGCYKILGYTNDDFTITLDKWKELFYEGNWQKYYREAREQSDITGKFVVDYRMKTKSGDFKWIQCRGKIFKENDKFVKIIGSHIDIDEKKRIEVQLKESEQKYKSLFNSLSQGFALHEIITDSNGQPINYKFLDVNDAFCLLTGLEKDKIIGKTVLDVLPNTEKYWIESYGDVAINEKSIIFDHYSGEFDKHFSVVAYSPHKGMFATIFTDITSMKFDEIKLRKLSQAVEQNPSSIVITDTDGNIEYVNNKFCEITGYSFQDAFSQNPKIIQSGLTPIETYKTLWDTIKSGNIWQGELMNKKRNGDFYWESATISPVFDNNGIIINFLAIKEDITENKKLSEQIEKQNLQYKNLLESLPNIVLIHINGKIIFANNYALSEIGLTEEEFYGHNIIDYIHSDYRNLIIENLKRRQAGEKIENYEIKVVLNNQVRDVFMYIDDADFHGKKATMVILIDITQRKIFEKELKESEEKFRVLSESSPFGILMYQEDEWIYANPAAERITGFKADELMIFKAWDIINEEYRDLVAYRAQNRLKGEKVTSSYEIKINTKSGEQKWCLLTAVIIQYKGKTTGLVSVADISNIKIIETKLRLSEEKYRNLAENTSDITWSIDKNLIITYISPADQKMRGYDAKDVIGTSFTNIIKPEILNPIIIKDENAYQSIKYKIIPNGVYEIEQLCSDGSFVWTEVSVSTVFDESGNFNGYHGITRNISVRKIAEEALKKSDKLKTEFLNNISHEIRTPLNGIMGFTNLLANGNVSENLKSKYFDIIRQSSSRLTKTIDDYMDISLIVSKSMKLNSKSFDLIKTLNKIHSEFFNESFKKRLDFNLKYENDINQFMVESDEELIIKMLKQLISNSIKFTESGSITFGFSQTESGINIFVTDTGIGMSSQEIFHATDYFYKTDFISNKTNDGSGLGLSITQGIVNLMNGKIEFISLDNYGLKVSIDLPLMPINIKNVETNLDKKNILLSENINILIAEDDDTNYLYLENILRNNGFINNQRAYNGAEAVEICNNLSKPDIILMDIRMPIMDGIEATRIIKESNKDIFIIATTAYAMKDEVDNIMKENFDGYISKPFNSVDLINTLKQFIQNHQ